MADAVGTQALALSSAVWAAVGWTSALTGAFMYADWRGATALRWTTKPLASLGFVGVAVAAGALGSDFGRVVLAALVLSLIGDVLLIPKSKASFLLGLVSFLLGHVAFAAAFFVRGLSWGSAGLALVVLAPISFFVARWLLAYVEGKMRAPVLAYTAVITVMVACAAATVAARGGPMLVVAAAAFYASDLAVARNQFVAPGFVNRAWGLPLYYGAQVLFALSIALAA